jgi:hypothetical protein
MVYGHGAVWVVFKNPKSEWITLRGHNGHNGHMFLVKWPWFLLSILCLLHLNLPDELFQCMKIREGKPTPQN